MKVQLKEGANRIWHVINVTSKTSILKSDSIHHRKLTLKVICI